MKKALIIGAAGFVGSYLIDHIQKHCIWSIVVTDFKYGTIQTNLGNLLEKDEEALYPWSVCIDDLEAFFLLM